MIYILGAFVCHQFFIGLTLGQLDLIFQNLVQSFIL